MAKNPGRPSRVEGERSYSRTVSLADSEWLVIADAARKYGTSASNVVRTMAKIVDEEKLGKAILEDLEVVDAGN